MKFYTEKLGETYRLGDLLTGYVLASPHVESPPLGGDAEYGVQLSHPVFVAVMTPCCSVGNQTIALAPLLKLNAKYFDNPYFVEDMTNINRPMTLEQAVPRSVWDQLGDLEKQRRLSQKKPHMFSLLEVFVYAPHQLLSRYRVSESRDITDGYYQIDFRSIYKVDCKQIVNRKQVPLAAKRLELTVEARSELRRKLANYFGRIPDEDVA